MKTFLFLLIGLISLQVSANEVSLEISLSPAGSFEAKTTKLVGKIEATKDGYTADKLTVLADDFTTGISLRDDHFRKYLKGEKKNNIITLSKVVAKDGTGTGTFNVNGTDKPMTFTYKKISPKKLEATVKLKASDFKFPDASYMGVTVDDEVVLKVSIDV